MHNLKMVFTSSPLWFLLLIPAVLLTLIPYFRLSKRYRKTRNRIVSMVLHLAIMVLAVSVLAGMMFTYQVPNSSNEILLLVDVSDTTNQAEIRRDEFVNSVLQQGKDDGYKIGVVTFGFTQNYAVPLTYDVDKIYTAYKTAELPDTTATDIAAALKYTATLFDSTEAAKIVLITDGQETDENSLTVIRSIALQGIKVDCAYIPSSYEGNDVQVTGLEFPDYHITTNEQCSISVTLESKYITTNTQVVLYDNGETDSENGTLTVDLPEGTQTLTFTHAFTTQGLHEIQIKVIESTDTLDENNQYSSYYYMEVFDKILVVEHSNKNSTATQSAELVELLRDEKAVYGSGAYEVDVLNLTTKTLTKADNSVLNNIVIETAEELCSYDEVIMNNIAVSDMTDEFQNALYTYVHDYGGGMLTVGGSEEDGETAHAYNRKDMYGTKYQQMLPVQAIDYTPPIGVIIIIDISGSMDTASTAGLTKREWAKEGAIACVNALSERDYVGIMTLDSTYATVLPLTSRSLEDTIKNAIRSIEGTGGTVYSDAIERAGQALIAFNKVDKRHVIIISDAEPNEQEDLYLPNIKRFYQNNDITFSFIGIGVSENETASIKMDNIAKAGGGKAYYLATDASLITQVIREDLSAPEIKEIELSDFYPTITNILSPVVNGVDYTTNVSTDSGDSEEGEDDDESSSDGTTSKKNSMTVQLSGFYGVKVRDNDYVILKGDYDVPIYAQWKYGNGMVGSFMCDLQGIWSADFMADDNGRLFLWNAIGNLMPTENIRQNSISVSLKEENYINSLSIIDKLDTGEYFDGTIASASDPTITVALSAVTSEEAKAENPNFYVTTALSANNQYSRCTFVAKASGVYVITVNKRNAAGEILQTTTLYKSFSYSQEYDLVAANATTNDNTIDSVTSSETVPTNTLLSTIASKGNGSYISSESPWEIFATLDPNIDKSYDPRLLFIILAMVMFLLDIAVRKFKFKWIHEIIRGYKEKKKSNADSGAKY
jgi:Mg-chelatase subunit ChlD